MIKFLILVLVLVTPMVKAQDKVGNIEDTTMMVRRVEARNYVSFAIGPSYLQRMGTEKSGQYAHLGYVWETTPFAAVKASTQGAFNFDDKNASILSGTLGANAYFTRTAVSPFVGFDFGYGLAATNDKELDTVHGWAGGLNLGIALFRTSTVQLHLTASYLKLFADPGKGQPSQRVISLGILF